MAAIRVGIVGATGYTGAELIRLLFSHPGVGSIALYAASNAGKPIASVLPSMAGLESRFTSSAILAFDAAAFSRDCDLSFCALPHDASEEIVAALRDRGVVTFDLSAAFRLRDSAVHAEWYGTRARPDLAIDAAYGLVELEREAIRSADLVAVAGCYPTAAILGLAPLSRAGMIEPRGIIVDAKSGVSGAGRSASAATHFPEVSEGIRAYKAAGKHRHTPEIEQALARIAGIPIHLTFTPHLVPAIRGILATSYATIREGVTAAECTEAARTLYEGSPSVAVLEPGSHPDTLWVRGSNRCHLAYVVDVRAQRVVVQSTIDNLIKGAAGQAIQSMNVRFGFEESTGLVGPGVWP